MKCTNRIETFNKQQIQTINNAVSVAEELVSNHFKMSASEWLHRRYDVKTLTDLAPNEIVHGPFAQVIRYVGYQRDSQLAPGSYDFYKICLQDHAILAALRDEPNFRLMPFALYIVTHELIHIVRFSKFLQNFVASAEEKLREETRVHRLTQEILTRINVSGLSPVLLFYSQWQNPIEGLICG
jgi:hypothetical protein